MGRFIIRKLVEAEFLITNDDTSERGCEEICGGEQSLSLSLPLNVLKRVSRIKIGQCYRVREG